jgi:hypothetical protein
MRHFTHPSGSWDAASAATPQTFAFYVVSLVSFSIAGYLAVRLYRVVNPSGALAALAALVYPLFMVLTLWTYVVHIDADFSYPYDMPSLAFFTGGLLAIYARRFLPLLAILFFGTLNRETTLFLIGIYILDAASRYIPSRLLDPVDRHPRSLRLRDRFSLAQVLWLRVLALCAIWLAVKLTLAHHFAHNDNSEELRPHPRNLGRFASASCPCCSISAATSSRSSSSCAAASSPFASPTISISFPSGWPSCSTPVSSSKAASTANSSPSPR